MIDKAKLLIKKKHLLILGKSERDRYKFVSELLKSTNYETFRFPAKMEGIDDYLDFVKKNKLYHLSSILNFK